MERKICVLDPDSYCNDCGDCDCCDLDPDKVCDNCMKCIECGADYLAVEIDDLILNESDPEAN